MNKYFLPMKCGLLCLLFVFAASRVHGQEEDTLSGQTLGEVIISANKWEQKLNEVPNKLTKITKAQILRNNPQTAADLLGQTGAVFIQKSQLGGGSPMIRGFATNRILLVFDGVRMNNAIYRSGNLQNIISIDPLSTEAAEVIFGPGSLIYGSDAIGGVMDFHSLEARFSRDSQMLVRGTVLGRYASANKENTVHADMNFGWKKWSVLASFSSSRFGDLRMGRHGGQPSYLRPEYQVRENNMDLVVPNDDPRLQRFSGYDQLNFLQKIRFRPHPSLDMQYSFVYAGTGDAPRYDRLIQYRNGALRFAEWYYGPMLWRLHNLQVLHKRKKGLYNEGRITIAYQDYEESRVDRPRNSLLRTRQTERVDAVTLNADASKLVGAGELFYGLEYVYNKVGSEGVQTDISNGTASGYQSRYPDGSTWTATGMYGSYKINLHPDFTFTAGLRFNYNTLQASFDPAFIPFPYREISLKKGGLTGNAGVVYRPTDTWQLNGNIATGYRMPNVDDMGKLFESAPGNVTVPNPALGPEYAWNFEAGIIHNRRLRYRLELNAFHTILQDAIVRRPATFHGEDSILFDGVRSRVESLQNVARATIWGLQASAEWFFTPGLSLQVHANYISGKETDEEKDEQVPLRHAPPFYGSAYLRYRTGKFTAEASAIYHAEVSASNLAPSEQAKKEIYATDPDGNPYSPSWYTLNLKTSYQLTRHLLLTAGWENMTNRRYRPYSSGIVAAGSNLIFSLRAAL